MLLVCFVMLTFTGCTQQREEVQPLAIGTSGVADQSKADEAKRLLLTMEEVLEVKGVNVDQNIYLAPRVKHFERFNLERIRKEASDKVKGKYPEAKVHVSTDQKLFMELGKLEGQLKNRTISKGRLKKRVKELEEMMKG